MQQITDMLCVRKTAQKFLSTLLLMFISSCFLILNGCRDTTADKEFAIVIQMTLEDELVQRFKKKYMDVKSNFKESHINVTKRANSSGRMI